MLFHFQTFFFKTMLDFYKPSSSKETQQNVLKFQSKPVLYFFTFCNCVILLIHSVHKQTQMFRFILSIKRLSCSLNLHDLIDACFQIDFHSYIFLL